MSESLPQRPFIEGQNKQELKKHLISSAKELSQRLEGFPFPGVSVETLEGLQAVDDEYPGYTTPISELIDKMENGIKIVLGEDPESGNVFVLPLSSDDIIRDSLFPRHLDTIPKMDELLRSLILTQKALFVSEQKKD